jgi:hypothetical protein
MGGRAGVAEQLEEVAVSPAVRVVRPLRVLELDARPGVGVVEDEPGLARPGLRYMWIARAEPPAVPTGLAGNQWMSSVFDSP